MPAGDAALLTTVSVRFQTNGDDKDDDTYVTVTVKLMDGTTVATVSDPYGHFDNDSTSGPFDIPITTFPTRGQLKTGNVTLKIAPNGNDTWRFNFFVDMPFDDGAHLFARATGLQLTESQTTQSFGIE